MFRKVHRKLAALCAGITIFILAVMSVCYLYIAEKELRDNQFASFQNDMNTLLANLEQQTVITHEWLSKIEGGGKYLISLSDNGVEFLFNRRGQNAGRAAYFEAARAYYEAHYTPGEVYSPFTTSHTEFSFSMPDGPEEFYACAAVSDRDNGSFEVLILSSLQPLQQQIRKQRTLFFALDLTAALALFLFSWYFTKRLLLPLEENRKKQTQFVAAASHELRTPLAALLSSLSACQKAEPEEQKNFLDAAQSEGLRMNRLLNDLLTLANADNQGWSVSPAPTELDTLLLDSYEAFEALAREKGITLSVCLPEESLSACLCDRERISQVLAVLIHNALSYTQTGGRVELSLQAGEKIFMLRVADNGPGIPDDQKEHIFERFYRADISRSKKDHFGLGLCIAYEIVRAHRGRIAVSDTPGGGSTFTVSLPRM